jgi:hypothetical protein
VVANVDHRNVFVAQKDGDRFKKFVPVSVNIYIYSGIALQPQIRRTQWQHALKIKQNASLFQINAEIAGRHTQVLVVRHRQYQRIVVPIARSLSQ